MVVLEIKTIATIYIYIYIYKLSFIDTLFYCITTLQCCLATWDDSSWDENLANPKTIIPPSISEGISLCIYLLIYTLGSQSAQFMRRALHLCVFGSQQFPTWVLNSQVGEHIYCHPQTDCFIVSQLFSVARHVRYLTLRSKPGWLYIYI